MSKDMLDIEPKQLVELGEYVVDYKQPDHVPTGPGGDVIVWNSDWARDEFADGRKGKRRYKISAVRFGAPMAMDAIKNWCRENKKILSPSRPSVDLTTDSFLSSLKVEEKVTPLILLAHTHPRFTIGRVGKYWSETERHLYLAYYSGVGKYELGSVCRMSYDPFGGRFSCFLVLEELPLEV